MTHLTGHYPATKVMQKLHAFVSGTLRRGHEAIEGLWLHPCFIDNQQVLVHCPKLADYNPSYFQQLVKFASSNNVQLLADRRADSRGVGNDRRRAWLPVVVLGLSLFTPVASADQITTLQLASNVNTNLVASSLTNHIAPPVLATQLKKVGIPSSANSGFEGGAANLYWAQKIEQLLLARYEPRNSEPANMPAILQRMATYYSRYPAVQSLFSELDAHPWRLSFAVNTFETVVQRSRFSVREVVVRFDPFSGAQLKFNTRCALKKDFCYASPADVLLHELLHVKAVWADSDKPGSHLGTLFGSGVYAYQHEYKTIEAEARLYKSMRLIDSKPRPLRTDHVGKTLSVACVTCLQ